MRRLGSTIGRGVALVLLGVIGFLLAGCTTEPENVSARPWSAPKQWEGGLPSGLYEGR